MKPNGKGTRYRLRRGCGVDAKTVAEELEKIYSAHGKITPRIVVDESQSDECPLHPVFTWDQAKAADLRRLDEARWLIKSVHIIGERDEDLGCAFVHVSFASEGETIEAEYHPVRVVVENPDMYAAAMSELQRKLHEVQQAVSKLAQAAKNGKQKQLATRVADKIRQASEIIQKGKKHGSEKNSTKE